MYRIRKLLSCLLVLASMILCAMPAFADVIYEPMDEFYLSRRMHCEYHDRSYITNGPDGDVAVYVNPESDEVVKVLENGVEVYISYTYQDDEGNHWGCWENWKTHESGWIPMQYLELIYDGKSFDEDHGAEYQQESGMLSDTYSGQEIYFWEYPGSSTGYPTIYGEAYGPEYHVVYTDENGVRWGKVWYYMSFGGWINLDNPTADYETLYPTEPTQPTEEAIAEPTEGTEPEVESMPDKSVNVTVVTIVAVAAVAVVTAALLIVLKRKK